MLNTARPSLQRLFQVLAKNANQDFLAQWIKNKLALIPSQKKPILVHLAGIPGAGKSTYCQTLIQQHPEAFHLAFDEIMVNLPLYQQSSSTKTAFSQCEAPAKAIGYGLLAEAIHRKVDIIFDHSAANQDHLAFIKLLKQAGIYHLSLHYLPLDIETALARTQQREQVTNRHVPIDLIHTRYELLNNLLPDYKSLVDEFIVIKPNSDY